VLGVQRPGQLAHVDTARTEGQSSSQALTVGKATRRDERHAERLSRPAQQDEVGDVRLPNVAGAFEAVDGQEVDAELDGGLGVPDGGALVQDGRVDLLQLLNNRAWAVAGRLNDLDAFVDDDLCVRGVVRGDEGGQERQVDAKGVLGHGAASADLLAQVFGSGLRERGQLQTRSVLGLTECLDRCVLSPGLRRY
jgi:hypothetical protein